MKLLKQISLFYQEGSSDKVYEVELCEAGAGEFVVNFRYGRRGNNLREGTKTVFPLKLDEAELVFSKLVAEKKAKGYRVVEGSALEVSVTKDSRTEGYCKQEVEDALIARLQGDGGDVAWSRSRVLWRVGELRAVTVWPVMRKLVGDLDRLEAYSFTWAVGRMGLKDASEELALLAKNFCGSPDVMRAISHTRQLTGVGGDLLATLPEDWAFCIRAGDGHALESILMASDPSDDRVVKWVDVLSTLAIDSAMVREVLYRLVQQVDLKYGWFRVIRHLFKMAEMRRDAELYGSIAMRIEGGVSNGAGKYEVVDKKWQWVKTRAFSAATKQYFRRRVVRTLETAIKDDDVETFITLSTGILAALTEATAKNPRRIVESWHWNSDSRQTEKSVFLSPEYGQFYALTWILLGGLPELDSNRSSLSWSYRNGQLPDTDGMRTEVYAELWDGAPDAILYLLKAAKHQLVASFAVRVWRANAHFANEAKADDLRSMLSQPFNDILQLAIELVHDRWDENHPDGDILLALLSCHWSAGRDLGVKWLNGCKLLEQNEFLAQLLICNSGDHLPQVHLILDESRGLNVKGALAILIEWSLEKELDCYCFGQAIQWVYRYDPDAFQIVELSIIEKFVAAEDEARQMISCYGILAQKRLARRLSEEDLMMPLHSTYTGVRALGIDVLGALNDSDLARHDVLLASCVTSGDSGVREAVRSIITRLAQRDRRFAASLVDEIYPLLLRAEKFDDLHDDILRLLTNELSDYLGAISVGQYRDILRSKYAAAHEFGFYLLKNDADLAAEPLLQLVEWADHEHLDLRMFILEYFAEDEGRVIRQLEDVIVLAESDWPETRSYFFGLIRERVPEDCWQADLLIGLCDSNVLEVQNLGKEMITARFREEDGWSYLSKLSQHPAVDLQLFATSFLTDFAGGNESKILELDLYFRTVLGRVGAGRVAKERVFVFLESEASCNDAVRDYVVKLMYHHSATMAVGDRARCLQVLVKLKGLGADIPLMTNTVKVWNRTESTNAI